MAIESLWDAVRAAGDCNTFSGSSLWRITSPHIDSRRLDDAVRLGWLTESERMDADRRGAAELRSRFGARRLLRRLVVAASLGQSPTEVAVEAECSRCGGTSHGRPYIAAAVAHAPSISTSSIDDRIVVALGEGSVGVDIESSSRAEPVDRLHGARAVAGWERVVGACSPHAPTVEIWSALEALAKTTGRGLLASPVELDAAIAAHRLTWIPDGAGRTICVALPESAPPLTTIDVAV